MGANEPRTRARDVDRVRAMADLDEALTDGQLTKDEHRDRSARARAAVTMDELSDLVGDLQGTDSWGNASQSAPESGRRDRRTVLFGAGLGAAGTLLCAGVIVALVFAVGAARDAVTEDDLPSDPVVAGTLFTKSGLDQLVTAAKAKFHTTVVHGVHIYTDSATIHVVDKSSPNGTTQYDYSPGGEFHSPSQYGGQAVASGDQNTTVDLADVDTKKVAALIAVAPAKLGVTTANVGNDKFRVTVSGDDGGEIWMGVNNNGMDSHLVAHLDGRIKGIDKCGWGC